MTSPDARRDAAADLALRRALEQQVAALVPIAAGLHAAVAHPPVAPADWHGPASDAYASLEARMRSRVAEAERAVAADAADAAGSRSETSVPDVRASAAAASGRHRPGARRAALGEPARARRRDRGRHRRAHRADRAARAAARGARADARALDRVDALGVGRARRRVRERRRRRRAAQRAQLDAARSAVRAAAEIAGAHRRRPAAGDRRLRGGRGRAAGAGAAPRQLLGILWGPAIRGRAHRRRCPVVLLARAGGHRPGRPAARRAAALVPRPSRADHRPGVRRGGARDGDERRRCWPARRRACRPASRRSSRRAYGFTGVRGRRGDHARGAARPFGLFRETPVSVERVATRTRRARRAASVDGSPGAGGRPGAHRALRRSRRAAALRRLRRADRDLLAGRRPTSRGISRATSRASPGSTPGRCGRPSSRCATPGSGRTTRCSSSASRRAGWSPPGSRRPATGTPPASRPTAPRRAHRAAGRPRRAWPSATPTTSSRLSRGPQLDHHLLQVERRAFADGRPIPTDRAGAGAPARGVRRDRAPWSTRRRSDGGARADRGDGRVHVRLRRARRARRSP